jgi:hypothetical protein
LCLLRSLLKNSDRLKGFEGFEEFKGSIACGVQRSKVQLPAAFKSSIACGVQSSIVQLAAFKCSIACGVQSSKVQLPAAFNVQRFNCLKMFEAALKSSKVQLSAAFKV